MVKTSITIVVSVPNDIPLSGVKDVISTALSSVGCSISGIALSAGDTSIREVSNEKKQE